jgi:hypothetical protein
VVYLVIIVLVALLGITRLWLQQRRELSQLDTIEGFSSALEAMKPEMPASRPEPTRRLASESRKPSQPAPQSRRGWRLSRRADASTRGLLAWFIARPKAERDRREEARRRIEARRAARQESLSAGRRGYRAPAPRLRDIAYETIELTDERVFAGRQERPRYERVSIGSTQPSYAVRYRHHSG